MDKLVCPDCGAVIDEVMLEKFVTKTFKVDYENKLLVPVYEFQGWEFDDYAAHCQNCDSLNVDELLIDFEAVGVVH